MPTTLPPRSLAVAFAVVLSTLSTSTLLSQQRATFVQVNEIGRNFRSVGYDARALNILTQAQGPQDIAVMNALADSVAAIAILHPGSTTHASRVRSLALSALGQAAAGESGLPGVTRAVPFAGAAERLKRVSENSQDVGVRSTALTLLGEVDRSAAFLQYLRHVATSEDNRAASAIELLVDTRGTQGRAIARELYRRRLVVDRVALHVLEGKASALGW